MMKTYICLVLMCFAPLAKESYTASTSHKLQHLIRTDTAPRIYDNENGVLWEVDELQIRSLKPQIVSPVQAVGGLTAEDIDVLSTLLLAIVGAELSQCVLGIVWDSGFGESVIVDRLSLLPNAKQMVSVVEGDEMSHLLWQAEQCRGYILLLSDPSPLMHHTDRTPHYDWDYSGRFVVVGLNKDHLEAFTKTSKGRKTEHIVGILKDSHGNFMVFINLLYKNHRLARVFTWPSNTTTQRMRIDVQNYDSSSLHMMQVILNPRSPSYVFPDKTRNLGGATLNVVTFLFPPEVMHRRGNNGNVVDMYGGNIRLVQAVAGVLNFTIHFIQPPPGELWGKRMPNGTWNGMVGYFARGEGDIGAANVFITALSGRKQFQEYTSPYAQEMTCFLIKRGARLPRWQSLALPFTQETWLAVLMMALLAGPLLYILSRPLVTRGEKLTRGSLAFASLYTFGVHLRNSRPLLPIRSSLQVFTAFLWIYVIIVTQAYSANLTAFLTVERVPEGINTLKDLYLSSLPIYGLGPFFGNNLASAKNEYARGLSSRFIILPKLEGVLNHVLRGQGVYIASSNHLIYTISLHTSPQGSPTLKLMRECFQPFSLGMGLQSHSPLKKNLDGAVTRIVEAGLGHPWRDETLFIAKQERRHEAVEQPASTTEEMSLEKTKTEKEEQSVSLSLEHLQSLFIVFGVGFCTSLIVFLTELAFRTSQGGDD